MADGRDDLGPGPATPRRSPPWGLAGMLVLVAVIEASISARDLDFTSPTQWDWRTAGRAIARKAPGRDVLLIGDSQIKFGVMPRVICELTGKATYNLALQTGQTTSSYYVLRRALDAGARPSAIVFDTTPHMLSQRVEINRVLWPELLSPAEALDMARTMRDPDFFASTLVDRLLPSARERFEIRASIVAALTGTTSSRREEIPRYRRNWKVNDGAQLMGERSPPEIDPAHWARSLYPYWLCRAANASYLDRFFALARSEKIPVYWLIAPIHPGVQAETEASGFDAGYSRFIDQVHARFPEVVVVDARHSGFAAGLFTDGIHLHRKGAMRLSAALADILKAPIPADRRVSIDLGRVAVVDLPIEDTNQSARILEAEATVRR